jgi:DNA invertase Pin-like site-specific DNA recombinase
MRTGFSYLRYSSPQQADGDSIERQTRCTQNWCERHRVQLDTSRTYLDRGRSAYTGKHRRQGSALAAFVAEVESGSVPRNSVLVIENLDRLSREHPWDAVHLLCGLVNSGIAVATINPSEMVYERGSNLTGLILATVEFGRAHSESKSKGERISSVWASKRKQARETGKIMTHHLPGWLEVRAGKIVFRPQRAALVKRIFELADSGYGFSLIVKKLTHDEVPTWGRGRVWSKAYIRKILTSRTVLGECLPKSKNEPDGSPILNYYPRLIDEATFDRVQKAIEQRTQNKPGRLGHKVASLFGGLLREAGTCEPIRIAWQVVGPDGPPRRKHRFLVTAKSMEGAEPSVSFPHAVFEQAILKLLREVNPADVIGQEPTSKSVVVAAELAAKEYRIREIEKALVADGDIPALVRVLRTLSEQAATLRQELAAARHEENNPRSEAWTQARSLLDVAGDEAQRLRLRSLLAALIMEIRVLIVRTKSHRFAAVQAFFAGGEATRDYLIWTRAVYGHEREWAACSLPSTLASGGLDLRERKDAQALRKQLTAADVEELANTLRKS